MYVHRSVILLVVAGVLLGVPTASQARPALSTSAATVAATARTPVVPDSTAGTGTRVSVRVLPAPTGTPTSPPTSTPTHPSTGHPKAGGGRGGNLPKTGANSRGLFEWGLTALIVGVALTWLASAAFRRRRQSTS